MERQYALNSAKTKKESQKDIKLVDPYSLKSQDQPLKKENLDKADQTLGKRKISKRLSNGDIQMREESEKQGLKYKSKEESVWCDNKQVSISNPGDG